MSEWDNLSMAHSIGALVLVGSALLAYRLPLGKALKMAAIWLLVFGAAFLAVSFIQSMSSGTSDNMPSNKEKSGDGRWI